MCSQWSNRIEDIVTDRYNLREEILDYKLSFNVKYNMEIYDKDHKCI